jgi:hypothetical protein
MVRSSRRKGAWEARRPSRVELGMEAATAHRPWICRRCGATREGRMSPLALDLSPTRSSGGREAASMEKCGREMRRRMWMEKKIKIKNLFAYSMTTKGV